MKRLIKYSILILFLSVYVAASGCTVKAVGDPDRPITINAHITLDVKGLEDTATDIEFTKLLVNDLYLYPVYPNPFNPVTKIKFNNPKKQHIQVAVYDATGKLISILTHSEKNKGTHIVTFDAHKYASGLYFIELKTEKSRKIERALLLK